MHSFTVDTWMGKVFCFFKQEPFRLERIFLPGCYPLADENSGSKETCADCPDTGGSRQAGQMADIIHAYFESGRPITIPWQWICMDNITVLQQRVLHITAQIPYGRVCSYREIAVELGKPGAARFVGNTMAANPWPLVIPCHRVILSNGAVGGFGGGSSMKKALLAHEMKTKHTMLAH